jgi:hypothetical protein
MVERVGLLAQLLCGVMQKRRAGFDVSFGAAWDSVHLSFPNILSAQAWQYE